MELQAAMALDRDAINTVMLRLLPPSAASPSSTSWLLLHTIPITASLSRTFSRLVSIEEAAIAQAPPEMHPSLATATPPAQSAPTRPMDSAASRSSASRRAAVLSSPSSSSSSMNASFTRAPVGWIELVRVGYIVSEIHAYCILLKCRTPSQAARMKAALEEGAALGVTAPVEFVSEERTVAVTRRTFAEPCDGEEKETAIVEGAAEEQLVVGPSASPSVAAEPMAASSPNLEGSNDRTCTVPAGHSAAAAAGGSAGGKAQQWYHEVHTMTLFDAITTIYPVRDGDAAENNDDDDDGDSRACAMRRSGRVSSVSLQLQQQLGSTRRSQMCSPYPQVLRRPQSDQAMSAPSSPSAQQQQQQQQQRRSPFPPSSTTAPPSTPPAAGGTRGRVSKGAAPSRPVPTPTPTTTTTTTATTMASPAAAAPHASPQPQVSATHHAHTPLHLPQACTDAGASPLQLDGVPGKAKGTASEALAKVFPFPTTGGLSDEFCAICQVDPLRSGACVTTLCQHTFHLHCYAQLPSSAAECPLCRFSVYELLNDARCEVCRTYEDLWVCLVCGHVACGRARRDHQQDHYRASGHSCSWQSSTNRIWNLSSRMFLHQEVALLLDGAEAEASHADAPGMEQLRWMSWAEPLDEDLQEAMNESKEEAVAHYYTEFLRQLAEEQRLYYEKRQAELRDRRARRQWRLEMEKCEESERLARETEARSARAKPHDLPIAAAAAAAASTTTSSLLAYASVHGVVREERRQRRRVLAEYASAMVELLQEAQRGYTSMYNGLKAARDDAQQQVLLRSHFNSGLVAQMEQVRQRTHETARKGERSAQAKAAEEAVLQKRVEDALAAL